MTISASYARDSEYVPWRPTQLPSRVCLPAKSAGIMRTQDQPKGILAQEKIFCRICNKEQSVHFFHLLEFFAPVEAKLRRLVEGREVCDVRRVREEVGVGLLHVVDEHAELGPPVTDVVMSENLGETGPDHTKASDSSEHAFASYTEKRNVAILHAALMITHDTLRPCTRVSARNTIQGRGIANQLIGSCPRTVNGLELTVWPQNSSTRQMASPMMVLRRCPTCISLAMLGLEKSTTTRTCFTSGGAGPCCQDKSNIWKFQTPAFSKSRGCCTEIPTKCLASVLDLPSRKTYAK